MTIKTFLNSLRNEQGGALVETSLTLPVLFAMILGAAEFTRVAYCSIEAVSAARAGVSYGAENGGTAGDTAGITYAAQNDAPNIPGLQVTKISSFYTCSDGNPVDNTKTINGQCAAHLEETLTVQTQVQLDPLIHVPGLPKTYTVTGSASQLCLQ